MPQHEITGVRDGTYTHWRAYHAPKLNTQLAFDFDAEADADRMPYSFWHRSGTEADLPRWLYHLDIDSIERRSDRAGNYYFVGVAETKRYGWIWHPSAIGEVQTVTVTARAWEAYQKRAVACWLLEYLPTDSMDYRAGIDRFWVADLSHVTVTPDTQASERAVREALSCKLAMEPVEYASFLVGLPLSARRAFAKQAVPA